MIRLFVAAIFCFFGLSGNAQLQPDPEGYVSLKDFLRETGMSKGMLAENSYIIKNSDTLVRISGFRNQRDDLVTVPFDYRSKPFTELYKSIGFKDSNVKDTIPGRMRYWLDDIKIFFAEEVVKEDKKGLSEFALEIGGKVDSLNIEVVEKLADANYIIYYKDHYNFEPNMRENADLDYYLHWNGPYIKKGSLRISKERYFNDEERLQRLKAYFFRTLGYFDTTKELACGNYFSNCIDVDNSISQLDLELLQYHYSYGVCKGVTLDIYEEQLETAEKYRLMPRHSFAVSHHKKIFER